MNPQHYDYPGDELITAVTIHANLNASQTEADGTWSVHCPQWKFHGHDKNLTRLVAQLVAEIETHNQECEQGEMGWWKDPKKLAQAAFGGVNHEKKQAEKRQASRRKKWAPIPDNGKMTPNRNIKP